MIIVVAWLLGIGVTMFIAVFTRFYSLFRLGYSVTQSIRTDLYTAVLSQNLGFFDEPDHASSNMTTAMAEDTQQINEVSTNSMSPVLTGAFALISGCIFAYVFSW